MPQSLDAGLAEVRALLLRPDTLIRAVAAGRRRGSAPSLVRAELRPIDLKTGRLLQIVTSDGTRPYTRNHAFGPDAEAAVDKLLGEPFGNWHVESVEQTLQLRVTKRGEAQIHRGAGVSASGATSHDRPKEHLLDPADPLYEVIGGSAAKRRQVDAFLRSLAATLDSEDLPSPLHVVDLGCGNAYLTFAAYRYLAQRGGDVRVTGVDTREDQRARNTELAEQLGCADRVQFVAGTIVDAQLSDVDVVLALHACDTATDEALARAVGWQARWVLAAPCCHHDVAAQLRAQPTPPPFGGLTRYGILRERFADVLTDTLRASLLRLYGYKVEVVEFVDSRHTPRNLLIRARYTGAAGSADQRAEYDDLVHMWRVTPALATLLGTVPGA